MTDKEQGGGPANPHRGEIEIWLKTPPSWKKQRFVMRPTWEALAEIESVTGKGIVRLARDFATKDFMVSDQAAVITAGIRAGAGQADIAQVRQMLFRTGCDKCFDAPFQLLLKAWAGDEEETNGEGETQAAER